MTRKNLPVLILLAASGVLLLYFLSWHWQLGLTRYFDVDEYAHLHWTAKLLQGQRPYVDFLTFFPPGYWLFLSLSFIGGWGTTAPFITARIWQFAVFAGMAASSGYLFWMLRRSWAALLAAAFFAFLPLPFDKYLEIRPDSLATLTLLLAMIAQVKWLEGGKKTVSGFASGALYAATLLILPKMLPNAAIGALVFAYAGWHRAGGKLSFAKLWPELKYPVAGFLFPAGVFGLWALSLGNLPLVVYSLVTLPVEANRISRYFIMMPDLFFYPNGIYYGVNGWHRGLYANHALYIAGVLAGVYRLVAPAIPRGRDRIAGELLVAAQFLIQVVFYVQIVPLKHAQYLIPIGVFVAFYAADAVDSLWKRVSRREIGRIVFTVFFLAVSFEAVSIFGMVNGVKKTWTNTEGLAELSRLYQAIPQQEYVLDLDGRFLFNPDPYYACCIPFGQFAEFLSRPLPPLPESLEQTGTRFINQGELKRVNTLPWETQGYIGSNFRELEGYPIILIR